MKATLDELVRDYGGPVTLEQGEVKAFLYPVTAKSRENLRLCLGDAGSIPAGVFVYIGPLEPEMQEGSTVQHAGESYLVHRAETLELAGTPLYRWGLLTKVGQPWPES